ncbi:MAG: DUF2752 domain-containing protein [Leeuwenhoekiella sp.]
METLLGIFVKYKYVLIGLFILPALCLFYFYNPTENTFFLQCPFYRLTHLYCPLCGGQRALHSLLHFNFIEMFQDNLLFSAALIVGAYNLVCIFFKKQPFRVKNRLYKPKIQLIIIAIVLIFWILRNIPAQPFYYLAPYN